MRARFVVSHAFLYDLPEDSRISLERRDTTSTRYLLLGRLSATVMPRRGYAVTAGAQSLHEQLGADGTYRTPVFNRYLQLFVDLRLTFADVIADFTQG